MGCTIISPLPETSTYIICKLHVYLGTGLCQAWQVQEENIPEGLTVFAQHSDCDDHFMQANLPLLGKTYINYLYLCNLNWAFQTHE